MSKFSVRINESQFSPEQLNIIRSALACAAQAHEGQTRRSGDPYIIHPIAVAETVAEWGLDTDAIAAALLHDTLEDTELTTKQIHDQFGGSVTALVQGLTKLAQIEAMPQAEAESGRIEASNENLRRLLLASTEDLRVLLIKLADRRHNLQTLGHLTPDKRKRIARESLDIFAPLADRLGMGLLKGEIEDLSFRYWLPEEFSALERQVRATTKNSERYLVKLRHEISLLLKAGGVEVMTVEGRQKHLYSIHKKLIKTDGDIDKLYDLIAIRIIVPDIPRCYQAMGLLHQRFKPLIYRIKDYIAVPKPNGYRSLHTTVFALDGRITEIQIRTPEMHAEAEYGLAAHFFYDSQKGSRTYTDGNGVIEVPQHLRWVNELKSLQQAAASGQEFAEGAKLELFADRIFVFSPKGDLYDLPEGATPLDFAFAVHSEIGLKTSGARINGRMTTLDSRLENRDVVEILTRREPAPNRDWLNFVRTAAARNRIRAWFRAASRDANIASGRSAIELELRAWGFKRLEEVPKPAIAAAVDALPGRDIEDILAGVGEGSLSTPQVLRRMFPQEMAKPNTAPVIKRSASTGKVLVNGTKLPYNLSPCCSPVFPQPITGFVTRGKGVTVHRVGCSNLPLEVDRLTDCHWELKHDGSERLNCLINIQAYNRVGLLRDLTERVAERGLNINGMSTENREDQLSDVRFYLEVGDLYELASVMRQLEKVPGVQGIVHVKE